jgi:hypothetical protein
MQCYIMVRGNHSVYILNFGMYRVTPPSFLPLHPTASPRENHQIVIRHIYNSDMSAAFIFHTIKSRYVQYVFKHIQQATKYRNS